MKILVVVPALGAIYGGPSKSVIELVNALGSLNINVDVVTTNANGADTLDVPLQTWINEKFYRIQYFPCWWLNDYKISLPLTKWLFSHVSDYNLVHTNAIFSYVNLPAYWACQWHKVPYVVTPRGMLEPWALAYKSGKKRFYYAWLEKPALERSKAIQMLAASEADRVKNLQLKAPLIIVPNGVQSQDFEKLPDPELFYQHFPETRNKPLILFLGRIDPKKGLDLLASAFEKVRAVRPDTHLIVAGPDNIGFLPTAQSYFAVAGCDEAVTFTGILSGLIKYAALAAARVYVAPSYSEGFSMSVLEGMASGLPCVITTGCNFPEAGEAKAARVVPINSDDIASAILECLQHPEAAKEMGDRAREFIFQKYTWHQIATNLSQIYQAILTNQTLPTFYQVNPN
ncbi:MAG TPA: glycosyltransferase [Oscillatoriaceae cyanobacterium M33_DOE_052]|uniref:Glycosyltransferase n=1 Tax=Planktothricoides sp. SpSt-374 TaxID=2282167 RepID=A0A7C3VE68_9CYAN|nr:glycosyltransferase [Oscillatoriaceae cyanobacterium M33_DOE_052]